MKSTIDAPAITLNPATASGKNATHREILPLFDIPEPGDNDVLSGRGVTTNKHAGNVNFRSLVALNKELYVTSTKKQKMAISRSIVEAVRSMNPPGRFLDKDPATGLWADIGDRKAVEKTSQALRDGAATLRKQLSEDLGDPDFLSAVFEGDAAKSNNSTVRSDGSACSNGSNGDASGKKSSKPRLMKSALAKKGHRRAKSVPGPTETKPEPKKGQKKAKLDQVVPLLSTKPSSSEKKKSSTKLTHSRSSSLDTGVVLPKYAERPPSASSSVPNTIAVTSKSAAAPAAQIPVPKPEPSTPIRPSGSTSPTDKKLAAKQASACCWQETSSSSGSSSPANKKSVAKHAVISHWQDETNGELMSSPWSMGHSRNSSASSSTLALPPFFPMSPIGRHAPRAPRTLPQQHQHIFSCFQEPKSRPPISPMHRSWSPRDFQEQAPPASYHYRQSIGGHTCFSEGDVDIPSLDRAFDRNFEPDFSRDARTFLEEDIDIQMAPIMGPGEEDELSNVAAPTPLQLASDDKLRSRTPSINNKDELRYSPSLDCDMSEKSDLLGDVIMKNNEPSEDRILSPLPFMEDDSDIDLLESLPDYLHMPMASYGHYDKK